MPRSSAARAGARKDWSLVKTSGVVQKNREIKPLSEWVLLVFVFQEFYDVSVGLDETQRVAKGAV